MAAENDILAGLDISSLSSVTQAQLLQMINQAAPLVNKGLIIAQDTAPDIVNNPRYERYIWLDSSTDPPTPKIRNVGGASWDALAVGAGTITNTQINAAANIAITKLAIGTARYLIRTNAAGTALEFINPNAIFTNDDVPLEAIDRSAAPPGVKSYLQHNATTGVTDWIQIAFADFAAGDLLAVAKINPGTPNYVLATVGGAAAWAQVETLFSALDYTKITGGNALQTLRKNAANTAVEWVNPVFRYESAIVDSDVLNARFPAGANTTQAIAHGLSAKPKLIFPVILCTIDDTANNGWTVDDEIPFTSLFDQLIAAGDARGCPAFGIGGWDVTNVYVSARNMVAGDLFTFRKDNAAGTNHCSVVNRLNWKVKLYCYA